MKSILKILFFSVLLCMAVSCSSDKDSPDAFHTVKVVVDPSTNAEMHIMGIDENGGAGLWFQGHLERTFQAQYRMRSIIITCDDEKNTIHVMVWYDGKLVRDIIGNKYINAGYNFVE